MEQPNDFAEPCRDPGCAQTGRHFHWVEPGHALASCLFDIQCGNLPREADLAAIPANWRRLVMSVERRTHCQHCEGQRRTPRVMANTTSAADLTDLADIDQPAMSNWA